MSRRIYYEDIKDLNETEINPPPFEYMTPRDSISILITKPSQPLTCLEFCCWCNDPKYAGKCCEDID